MPLIIDAATLHPSTQLALAALEWLEPRISPARALDIGCGSGILSLTAAHLWNTEVLACDISPQAVQDMQENVAKFAPESAISVIRSDGLKHTDIKKHAPYDLILGNLLAQWQVAMARGMADILTQGGHVILSGMLAWQAEGVKQAFAAININIIQEFNDAEWVCYIGCHNSNNIHLTPVI